ncbi:MAG: hypothetical protein KTR35_18660 [Gammaproteobacteria bacterium]|nr:hypothetical protein [Gammaproteobacteria bacterium]
MSEPEPFGGLHAQRVLAFVGLCLLGGCDRTGESSEANDQRHTVEIATPGPIARADQRPGDAGLGKQALLNEPYVSCGLPLSVYQRVTSEAAVIPVPGRSGKAATLSYDATLWTNDEGVEVVSSNCLACHGSTLFGELVIGLGNEFADFTQNASDRVEEVGLFVQGEPETRVWQKYADRIAKIAPYLKTKTVGVNPANSLTMALIAHRDRHTIAWSEDPLLPLPTFETPPVSVPPWWRMKKKHAMFSMGEGRGDHARIMMAAAMLCSDSIEQLELIDAYAPDIRKYISSLEPPAYPFPTESDVVAQGEGVFNEHCAGCHGRYGEPSSYPNLLVDIEVIGTDSTLIDFAISDGKAYAQWFNESYFGQLSQAVPANGYVAPPLDGVWATAPFLHNGSVPTIRALLDSRLRPTYWMHEVDDANDPNSFDQHNIGWHHRVLDSGQDKPAVGVKRKRIYDTTIPGYSNSGHLFGDQLSDSDRSAVIEYLKTL